MWPALAAVVLAALPAAQAQERPAVPRGVACGTTDLISSLRLLSPLPGAMAVRIRPVLAEEQIRAFGDGRFLLHYSLRSVRPAGRGAPEAPDVVEQTARLLLEARRLLVEQGRWQDPQRGKPMDVYLMNTGSIGGDGKVEGSKKVKIRHSSAVVKAIAEGTIQWEKDPDFGYLVATAVPGIDDADYLQPKKMYERQGRLDEYKQLVAKYNNDRREYLRKWKGLSEEIVNAI